MAVTIKDIATRTKLSPATVSRVLNDSGYVSEANRKKVRSAVKELDYVPSALAKGLSSSTTSFVGVMVPEIDNPFFAGIIKGISSVADDEGLCIILCNTEENSDKEKKMLQMLRSQCIRGLLISTAVHSGEQEADYIHRFEQMGVPVVLIDREIVGADFDGVYVDDTKAMFDITTLLLNKGHQNIRLLAGNPKLDLCLNRVDGFRRAFQIKRLAYSEDWIYFGEFTKQFAYETTKKILAKERSQWPSAIVSSNNMLSLGALRAIYEIGLRIPEDIAFVAYDQLEETQIFNINITLAERDTVEIGRQAMRMLLDRLNRGANSQEKSSYKMVQSATVVSRGSENFPERPMRH